MSAVKRSVGRPVIGAAFTLRLPAALIAVLDARAEHEHTSRAHVIRALLESATVGDRPPARTTQRNR